MNPTRHFTNEDLHVRTMQNLTRNFNESQNKLTHALQSLSILQAENTALKRDAAISHEAKKSLEQTIMCLRHEIAQLKGEGATMPETGPEDEELEVLGKNVRWEDIEVMLGDVVGTGVAATDDFRFDIKSVGRKRWSGQGAPEQD